MVKTKPLRSLEGNKAKKLTDKKKDKHTRTRGIKVR